MLGTAIGIAAWGLITGVAMGNRGLPLPLMVLLSLFMRLSTCLWMRVIESELDMRSLTSAIMGAGSPSISSSRRSRTDVSR
jgi:hypothetical protein